MFRPKLIRQPKITSFASWVRVCNFDDPLQTFVSFSESSLRPGNVRFIPFSIQDSGFHFFLITEVFSGFCFIGFQKNSIKSFFFEVLELQADIPYFFLEAQSISEMKKNIAFLLLLRFSIWIGLGSKFIRWGVTITEAYVSLFTYVWNIE